MRTGNSAVRLGSNELQARATRVAADSPPTGSGLTTATGRATGGVRCHRFLRGEDTLVLAWAGPAPALGATEAGTPVDLPPADGRRDGSGVKVTQPLAAVGGTAWHPVTG